MPVDNGVRARIGVKEGIILGTLLGIILFLPLLFSHFSLRMWQEVSWHNPVDISMIEWSTAFLNIFLFFLLIETYRQSGRRIFLDTRDSTRLKFQPQTHGMDRWNEHFTWSCVGFFRGHNTQAGRFAANLFKLDPQLLV